MTQGVTLFLLTVQILSGMTQNSTHLLEGSVDKLFQRILASAALLMFVVVSSCGEDELVHTHDKPGMFLNEKSGFTVLKNGRKSLVVAMRKDDKEVRLETLWRPIRFSLMDPPQFCSRLVDQDNSVPAEACANPPKQWKYEDITPTKMLTREESCARSALVRQMYEVMKTSRPPAGREEAWDELLSVAKSFLKAAYSPLVEDGPPPVFHDEPGVEQVSRDALKERREVVLETRDDGEEEDDVCRLEGRL